jgi:peptidoglycan hydrolase CwlO-like protein
LTNRAGINNLPVYMTNLQSLSVAQLRKVVAIKERMERLEAKLAAIEGEESAAPARRRRLPAASRARIAAAQRRRWAKAKGKAAEPKAKRKRRVSRATRARLAAAARARWARAKAAGKATL